MNLVNPRKPGGEPFREPEGGSDYAHVTLLRILGQRYKESGNPVHAIEALIYAYDAGLAPPVWAMDWLVDGLRQFMSSEGEKDLERLLGIATGKQGKGKPVKDHLRGESNRTRIGFPAYVLETIFGLNASEALEAVWRRESSKYPGQVRPKHGDAYHRTWKKEFRSDWGDCVMDLFRCERQRREFLDSFPDEALPLDKTKLMAESERRIDPPDSLPRFTNLG